jgi:Tfp pilus assembly protein PilF
MARSILAFLLTFASAALLSSCRDTALDHYNLGIDALEHGDTAAALSHLEAAARARPSDPDMRIDYGVALLAAGQPRRAITELEAAVSIAPDSTIAHLDLAEAYKAIDDYSSARTEYERALKLSPELVEAMSGYAEMLLQQGRTDEAISLLVRAARLKPGHAPAQFHLGWHT